MEMLQWTIILFVVAAILTAAIYLAINLKKHMKLPAKKQKQSKIKAKKEKNSASVEPPPPPKPTYSLEAKKQPPVSRYSGNEQDYVPSNEFTGEKVEYSAFAQPSMRRRRPMPQRVPPQAPPVDDFEQFRRAHGYSATIKEQIQNLSPEMKAILFGNVLDKKDDQF